MTGRKASAFCEAQAKVAESDMAVHPKSNLD